jgi:hypothetical protein
MYDMNMTYDDNLTLFFLIRVPSIFNTCIYSLDYLCLLVKILNTHNHNKIIIP